MREVCGRIQVPGTPGPQLGPDGPVIVGVTSQNGDLLGLFKLLTTYYSWDVILQVENSRETERFA